MSGYRVIENGAAVRFLYRGAMLEGVIVGRQWDPNRKPGAGRVKYDIETAYGFCSGVPALSVERATETA